MELNENICPICHRDVKGKDLLDKIDTIILKYNNLPDLINDVKKVLKEQLEANGIYQGKWWIIFSGYR